MIRILLFICLASCASATPATYRDLVRARLSGSTNLPARIADEPSRHVLRTDATSAVVRVISPSGRITTNTVRLALMPGAVRVEADQTVYRAEQAAITRLALALAARAGTPTNELSGPSTSASERRAVLFRTATEDAAKSDTLPLSAAAAAGAAAAAAAAALLRRKDSTGASNQAGPKPPASADGAPTS
jgi:hypothetical protein